MTGLIVRKEGYKMFEEILKELQELIAESDYLGLDPRKYINVVDEFAHLLSVEGFNRSLCSFEK